MKLKEQIQVVKRWVVRNQKVAMALPLILIMTSFFVIENLKDFQMGGNDAANLNGFNSELPGETPTLDSDTAGRLWKVKDSLEKEEVEVLPLTNHHQGESKPLRYKAQLPISDYRDDWLLVQR